MLIWLQVLLKWYLPPHPFSFLLRPMVDPYSSVPCMSFHCYQIVCCNAGLYAAFGKIQLDVSFSILGFLESLTKSALAMWLAVGIEAGGGLSSVPSGDDFPSQKPACYLSSIRLLCDKPQQYCHKWSRPWKWPPWKAVPRKALQAAGQNGKKMHRPVLRRAASLKGSFQVQFTLHFKRQKRILEKGGQES